MCTHKMMVSLCLAALIAFLAPSEAKTQGETARASVDSSGAQANGESEGYSAMSGDGRYVAFKSWADNLVPDDTNGKRDIFVHNIFSLFADSSVLPEAGGTVNFTLDAGLTNASRNYLMLGGVTGTSPGTPLPGGAVTLPLNWDAFTNIVVSLINTPVFADFMGTLNVSGQASAQMNVSALPPGPAGLVMYFAYGLSSPFNFASNPMDVTVVP